ncbi:MbtH family protein [Corynebacterium pseudodiphtheriticum]|nr:antibiotic synthesis protein MbtH [Corynebacterium sp. EPI-003-04-2554_SCH2473622]RUP88142.1 MbtH family protein [Corynebacterium pseudodiphtheriticum]RUP93081.1 MbtH family protein [Corynebacterium pseudodiphtheriticum]RUP98050.1 MbtH family protein [Corynebacterium pseudodiphtheriticum]RUQ01742.1 MbtH family protein [Corynebacterium pseudodiphtheriticum]
MLSSNPFDDEQGSFFALINDKGEYSLWPSFAAVPEGWTVALGDLSRGVDGGVSRDEAMEFIDREWTTLQPVGKPHE